MRASAFVKSACRGVVFVSQRVTMGLGVHTDRQQGGHTMQEHSPIRTDRETARVKLVEKIASQRRLLADPRGFSTIDPNYIIADAEFRLRWIDCAPEGANHNVAPMQDKRGVPLGSVWSENVGPCRNLREARIARGRHPFAIEYLS